MQPRPDLGLILQELKSRSQASFSKLPVTGQLERLRDQAFPEQDAFVMAKARYLAALCTRRAGKSNGLGLRFLRTMTRHAGCFCPYTALTRESAKNIMWDILKEQDERFKIGAKFSESNLTMTLPNESRLQLFGADMKNFIKRLKGVKTPGAGIDESQDFGDHIRSLVDDVFGPAILDYPDGWLALTGTPGPIPVGLFFEITHENKHGYDVHRWSLLSNPYIPDPRAFVADLRAKKEWPEDHPTLQREYQGKWVTDREALVFKYDEDMCDFEDLPQHPGRWEHVLGVDIGWHDADAIAVIGWHPKIKDAYLLQEDVQSGQDITGLVNRLSRYVETYQPIKIVMDTAGLGKKIAEEITRRYAIPIEAAEKTRMYEFIELMNDAMRRGRFKARRESIFVHDSQRLKWDTDSVKPKISDVFHSDICMAALYGYREALHWLHEPEIEKPKPGTPAYMAQEERDMERMLEDGLRPQPDADVWGDLGMDWG